MPSNYPTSADVFDEPSAPATTPLGSPGDSNPPRAHTPHHRDLGDAIEAIEVKLGTTAQSGTPGSVLFADASGNIRQDNANLFWDDTNNELEFGSGVKVIWGGDTNLYRSSAGVLGTSDDLVTGGALGVGTFVNSAGSEFRSNNTKVVGAQGAAVADATDAGSAITQLNLLLARARAHGLIAT